MVIPPRIRRKRPIEIFRFRVGKVEAVRCFRRKSCSFGATDFNIAANFIGACDEREFSWPDSSTWPRINGNYLIASIKNSNETAVTNMSKRILGNLLQSAEQFINFTDLYFPSIVRKKSQQILISTVLENLLRIDLLKSIESVQSSSFDSRDKFAKIVIGTQVARSADSMISLLERLKG